MAPGRSVERRRTDGKARAVHPEDAVLRLVDDLHDSGNVDESTWAALSSKFDANALLEMLAVVGFYHLISFVANGAGVEPEAWAPGFPGRR
jgi:4-carboxymuconolactone decarboxylase